MRALLFVLLSLFPVQPTLRISAKPDNISMIGSPHAALDYDAFEDLPGAYRIITDQVDEEHYIYLIPCSSGAYNTEYKAYEGNADYFTPIYFAQFSETSGWSGTPYIINPDFDYETNILTSRYLGRGLGDCGSAGTWVWHTGYRKFAMLEFSAKEFCDGQGKPGIFPLVFKLKSPPAIMNSN
ncbi:MAG: DUF1176 domain-containing protein [Devosiaceae bacterium]|nr:DUF1176 domain-containing protein [Devosiaceae bacterium]